MKRADVVIFYQRLAEADPHPKTELDYVNPYTLLVAVALSAQATDIGVNKATKRLFEAVDTPEAMIALGEAGLKEHIRTIGLFNTKAKNVIALSAKLVADHGGVVPHDRAALEALPGVGRKTANVVLNVAFGDPTIAVDTHIFRVANRTGLAPGKHVRAVEDRLVKVTPAAYRQHAHHWLILHGRYVCKARRPECWRCPVADLCAYRPKTPAPKAAPGRLAGGEKDRSMKTIAALVLMFAAASAVAAERKDAWRDATASGAALDCLPLRSIRETRVRDDRTIDFYANGGKVYRNILPNSCPGLGSERRFSYATSLSQLCSVDIITVFYQPPLMRGASCGLGAFQPVTGGGR